MNMDVRRGNGGDSLTPQEQKMVVLAQENLKKISTSGSPADVFAALRLVSPISGGMVGSFSERNPESLVACPSGLSDRMVEGFYGTSQEHLGLMFAPLFAVGAGRLVPATKGLAPAVREQIKIWQITVAEGYGETAGFKVCEPERGSKRFVFLTLALEASKMFTHRDHLMLEALQEPLYSALERLRVPLIPSEKIHMQIMEEHNRGYMLVSQASPERCLEMNLRARVLVERYAESAEVPAGRHLISDFAKYAVTKRRDAGPWTVVRRQGDGELKLRVHELNKESHDIGEDAWLVTMEETLYPVDVSPYVEFGFTPREIEIVQLLVDSEYTGKEIAEELGTSYHTVRTQIQNVRTKMGVKSRAALSAKLKQISRKRRP